jgi:hypothetical protein
MLSSLPSPSTFVTSVFVRTDLRVLLAALDEVLRHRLRQRRAADEAGADQLVDALGLEPAVLRAHGADHRHGADDGPVGELVREDAVLVGPGLHHLRADDDLRAQPYGLVQRQLCELRAADPLREAGIVLDARAGARLAARCVPLDDQRLEPLGDRGHRGGESGRPAPTISRS